MPTVTPPEELAGLLLIHGNGLKSQAVQIAHRQEIIEKWGGIPAGSRVLELGCGQGDCTIAIADCVGDNGTVEAIDPAPPGYGSPYTVHEAQKHISSGPLGPRVTFVHADPLLFLPAEDAVITEPKYDIAILAHCLWYFSSPSVISSTLRRLRAICKRIYIAEWSLSATLPTAQPHVYAVLTQGSLECRKTDTESNVRTVVSPAAIKELAEKAGLKVVSEASVTPREGLLDGKWEVDAVSDKDFVGEVEKNVTNERERAVVFALRDAMLRSLDAAGGRKNVTSMDVWCGVFEKA
ncbi:SAM-dependent methyltransferas-like protein [Pluteus cervinus]|uniref:SAM-dependent methyltransferas-like protein n=1 Tax=Pluteus cervinus TaxID=181527 RepID=A0ACD3BBY0_9AGAR|nr:SAM-dependent methyltransferas-like protein [Pluteus cervinus]